MLLLYTNMTLNLIMTDQWRTQDFRKGGGGEEICE